MRQESNQRKSSLHSPLVHQTFTKSAHKSPVYTNWLPNNTTHDTCKASQSYSRYTQDLKPTFRTSFSLIHLKTSSNSKDNWQLLSTVPEGFICMAVLMLFLCNLWLKMMIILTSSIRNQTAGKFKLSGLKKEKLRSHWLLNLLLKINLQSQSFSFKSSSRKSTTQKFTLWMMQS